jgi:hypothetical protein
LLGYTRLESRLLRIKEARLKPAYTGLAK